MALGETGTNSIPAFPFSGFFVFVVVLSLKWGGGSLNSTDSWGDWRGFWDGPLQLESLQYCPANLSSWRVGKGCLSDAYLSLPALRTLWASVHSPPGISEDCGVVRLRGGEGGPGWDQA